MFASIADFSTSTLAKKPNSGGTPASENIASTIRPANHGERRLSPFRSSIILALETRARQQPG